MDILLDEDKWDIIFDNSSVTTTSGIKHGVAQRLKIMLQTFETEWILNQTTGIPYFEKVLRKGVSKESVDLVFRDKILAEPGVIAITEWESSIDSNRAYSLTFKVLCSDDSVTDDITVDIGA